MESASRVGVSTHACDGALSRPPVSGRRGNGADEAESHPAGKDDPTRTGVPGNTPELRRHLRVRLTWRPASVRGASIVPSDQEVIRPTSACFVAWADSEFRTVPRQAARGTSLGQKRLLVMHLLACLPRRYHGLRAWSLRRRAPLRIETTRFRIHADPCLIATDLA